VGSGTGYSHDTRGFTHAIHYLHLNSEIFCTDLGPQLSLCLLSWPRLQGKDSSSGVVPYGYRRRYREHLTEWDCSCKRRHWLLKW
jgi:hypothetical protein